MTTPDSFPKPILVTGATGKQGKSVINSILSSSAKNDFTIIALTRNPDSPSAKALAQKSTTIKLIKGNLGDCPAIFKAALGATKGEPLYGVYSVQQAVQDGATQEREEKQGKGLIVAAMANNVKVFVYSSVDRGGDKSDSTPTYVPHFASKYNIERHLKEKTAGGGMTYTILRPVAFMESCNPGMLGKLFHTWLKMMKPGKPLAMIACADIGFFGAQGFLQPESPDYRNKAISLAGDELTFDTANKIFTEKMGYSMPTTFEFFARFVRWMVKEINIMLRWFDEEGYSVDMAKLKRLHPGLMDFGTWLETEGSFEKK